MLSEEGSELGGRNAYKEACGLRMPRWSADVYGRASTCFSRLASLCLDMSICVLFKVFVIVFRV